MSKEELKNEENILFNNIQAEFPEFKKSLQNNFLNLLVKAIATRGYSLKRLADSFIKKTTNIDDGDLDYRASFYNLTRLQAKKAYGTLYFTGLVGSQIPVNSYFIDGNYTNLESGLIANYQFNGIAIITDNIGVMTTNTINQLPSGAKINLIINNISYNNITIYDSNENGFKFNLELANSTYSANYNTDCLFLYVESVKEGFDFNKEGNLSFDINQIILGIDKTAYIIPQGINGGDDLESDERFKARWSLYRTGYIANFSEDFIKASLYELLPQLTRVFIQRATPIAGSVSIYPLFENRSNILPSFQEIEIIKNYLLNIAPVSIGIDNIVVNQIEKISININYNNFIPNNTNMNKAIIDSLNLFFKSQNGVGKDFSKNELYLYLLANCIDINNEKLQSINLIATDTTINDNQLAVLGNVNA